MQNYLCKKPMAKERAQRLIEHMPMANRLGATANRPLPMANSRYIHLFESLIVVSELAWAFLGANFLSKTCCFTIRKRGWDKNVFA
ncbi:hypothetical protein ACA30_05205 [Virgibacillus soli]|uniref:Uncharacterized protein n=1 Tax=Lederbergia galactosidilytica TaxID=217031 RepID=A0A178A0Y9_9BACI|nr:hypothetical protein ACA30_05205 [Virgibacillus soli]OAK73847.1 hypothetical protein ABB05_05260 [Lederbergia galactosidilytica]